MSKQKTPAGDASEQHNDFNELYAACVAANEELAAARRALEQAVQASDRASQRFEQAQQRCRALRRSWNDGSPILEENFDDPRTVKLREMSEMRKRLLGGES
jgi:hypothetical protein